MTNWCSISQTRRLRYLGQITQKHQSPLLHLRLATNRRNETRPGPGNATGSSLFEWCICLFNRHDDWTVRINLQRQLSANPTAGNKHSCTHIHWRHINVWLWLSALWADSCKSITIHTGRRSGALTCGVCGRRASDRSSRAGSCPQGSPVVCRKTCTAWCCWNSTGSVAQKVIGAYRRRFSWATVTAFRITKHEPMGGEVRGAEGGGDTCLKLFLALMAS